MSVTAFANEEGVAAPTQAVQSAAFTAKQTEALIAAKSVALAKDDASSLFFDVQNKAVYGQDAVFITSQAPTQVLEAEKKAAAVVKKIPVTAAITIKSVVSTENQAVLTTVQSDVYVAATVEETVTDIAQIAPANFANDKSEAVIARYQELINAQVETLAPVIKAFDGQVAIAFKARRNIGTFFAYATAVLQANSLTATAKTLQTFANGVVVLLVDVVADAAVVQKFAEEFVLSTMVPESEALTAAFFNGEFTAEEYAYLTAASKLVYYTIVSRPDEYLKLAEQLKDDHMALSRLRTLYTAIRREAVSHARIQQTFAKNVALSKKVFADFKLRQTTEGQVADNTEIPVLIKRQVNGVIEQQIFQASLALNKNTPKTNFFRVQKAAISFRLEGTFFADMDLPRLPFGVFFVLGADFQAFHVRFADVSRGGIRLIRSADENVWTKNVAGQFIESFNLAFTQNLKNKDIPEFGSKGTVLLNPDAQDQGIISFQRFIDSLLDLITPLADDVKLGHPQYFVNNYGKPEILFLGPDEGTAGVMSWAALHAKARGYAYWRAFTTGKPPKLGGIPHDTFGMTTNSVHRYVVGCIEKLGYKEEDITKIQTGGPDGDLGSNEIKISKDKTIIIIDGSGVLYDPEGINRAELTRLANARIMAENFDKSLLSPNGFFVSINDKDITLPNGEKVDNGMAFRNEFHLTKYAEADFFVPCGGRPNAIDLSNVHRCFNEQGKPKYKVVVEGANLFFTAEARQVLEDAGVVLYKDASSNKGGVTSSSLEVLAALALEPEVFEDKMACHDPKNPPVAYQKYAQEVLARIINDANLEFECIWMEHERTKLPRHVLTDKVSNKINQLNDEIHASELWDDMELRVAVLKKLLPQTLVDLVGFDTLVKTAPESYLKASFTAYLAAKYVYKTGIDATKEEFFKDVIAQYKQ